MSVITFWGGNNHCNYFSIYLETSFFPAVIICLYETPMNDQTKTNQDLIKDISV